MSEYIHIHLKGGIGNQLFQYIAGIAIANTNGGVLWIKNAILNKHSEKDYREKLYIRGGALSLQESPEENGNYIYQENGFKPWDPSDYSNIRNIILDGYFQYLPPIEKYIPLVCNDLITILQSNRNDLRTKYSIYDEESTSFLHVRRNDYLNYPTLHWIQDETYYIPAMNILNKNKRLLVISDDIPWCKNQAWLRKETIEIIDEPDEINGLMLMSLCKGGAIIANSTYSWWGAMLGCGIHSKNVIYPKKWFSDDKVYLFPSDWICI